MSAAGWLQFVVLGVLVAISTPILGTYMYRVYFTDKAPGDRVFLPVENFIYRVCGVDPEQEQRWRTYTMALLAFSLVSLLFTYALLRLQGHLPFNPDHLSAVGPGLSFSTAISFLTNTNWQSYAGESTMSHLSQMLALVLHQYLSAAVGMAVAVAFTRAIIRRRRTTIGNFWVDMVRSTTRILLPISFVFAFVFMSQGVIQNFHASRTYTTVAAQGVDGKGNPIVTQTVPGGPVASMEPIEDLGDNGGGFFNANTADPYQGPNMLIGLLVIWLAIMLPFAFPFTFGKAVGSMRQGWVVFASMAVLFILATVVVYPLEGSGNNKITLAGVSQTATATNPGGNLEGKDLRFGVAGSTMNAMGVTATSAGATGSAHESYTPLGGSVPLFNMMLGEVSPGGDGSGLYGKLILVLTAVFIAGLMVGRTPEYLGKKIQSQEMKLVVVYLLAVPLVTLAFAAAAIVFQSAQNSLLSSGPHGLTEMIYAYSSSANNNGSAFAGLSANTQWFNTTLGLTMLVGRYFTIIPVMAIGGSIVRKQVVPATAGTFRTDTPLFLGLLLAVTVVLVGLIYFPVVALGPIVEHLAGHF
jgi:potassium-transporting ATPase potassium-binding subunit